jgi:protein O-GlcNAc transferase
MKSLLRKLLSGARVGNGDNSNHAERPEAKTSQHSQQEGLQNLLSAGNKARAGGNFARAESAYRDVLRVDPRNAVAWLGLGLTFLDTNQFEASLNSFEQARDLLPMRADPHFLMGLAAQALGRSDEATTHWCDALNVQADFVPALNKLLPILTGARSPKSESLVRAALAQSPDNGDLYFLLGMVMNAREQPEQGLAAFTRCIEIDSGKMEAHLNRVKTLTMLNRGDLAEIAIRELLARAPNLIEARVEAARMAVSRRDFRVALAHSQAACVIDPRSAEAHILHGFALNGLADEDNALEEFRIAIECDPESVVARWMHAMAQIPQIVDADQEPAIRWDAFALELDRLDQWIGNTRLDAAAEAVGTMQPFFLAYREICNAPVLEQYGALCHRVMSHWLASRGYSSHPISRDGLIKVGIVSCNLIDHSVWNAIVKGWYLHLDREVVELHSFHLNPHADEQTTMAKQNSTSFLAGPLPLARWVEEILSSHIEILLFPEIGMDATTLKLASMRLAPIQMASWGHPETTGLPTMDYFLSAEDFEYEDSGASYSEKLVRLPHLGCSYQKLEVVPVEPDLTALGLTCDSVIFVCPGAPFKYAPQDDHVFIDIARNLPECRFVFFDYGGCPPMSEQLHARLSDRFESAGLSFGKVGVFIPWMPRASFYGLMQRCDVFLDTLGFSGFNTAIQAMECGFPVVTCEGRFMRGRFASAILRRLGLSDLVAIDKENYVAIAVRLARDKEWQQTVRRVILERRSVLFDDQSPIRAMEELFNSLCRPSNLLTCGEN